VVLLRVARFGSRGIVVCAVGLSSSLLQYPGEVAVGDVAVVQGPRLTSGLVVGWGVLVNLLCGGLRQGL